MLMNYDTAVKLYRKAIFDCCQEYLGCKTADDMYEIMTSEEGVQRFNRIVDTINSRVVSYTGIPRAMFRNVERLENPWPKSEKKLEILRNRWASMYDDQSLICTKGEEEMTPEEIKRHNDQILNRDFSKEFVEKMKNAI